MAGLMSIFSNQCELSSLDKVAEDGVAELSSAASPEVLAHSSPISIPKSPTMKNLPSTIAQTCANWVKSLQIRARAAMSDPDVSLYLWVSL